MVLDEIDIWGEEKHHFANRLYSLLHKPRMGIRQKQKSGREVGYSFSPPERITPGDFFDHMIDRQCLALASVTDGLANFICWDIDILFPQRLEVMREVLKSRAWDKASFAVTGSGYGRGKIFLILANRLPQSQAQNIGNEILNRATRHPLFGEYKKGQDISVFPTGGNGSSVRLFGRNRLRRSFGLCETPIDLEGNLSDLWYVKPIDIQARPLLTREPSETTTINGVNTVVPIEPRSPKIRTLIAEGYHGGSKNVVAKALLPFVSEALRIVGKNNIDAVRTVVLDWRRKFIGNSLDLSARTLTQLQSRDALARAFRIALENTSNAPNLWGDWHPLIWEELDRPGVHRRRLEAGWRIYKALTNYLVNRPTVSPHCFGITYQRIADLAGYADKSSAHDAVKIAEDLGFLYRLDLGEGKKGGLVTMFTFVGRGETLQSAYDAGVSTDSFQARLIDLHKRELQPRRGPDGRRPLLNREIEDEAA